MNARLFRYVSVGAMLAMALGSTLPARAATAKPVSPASPASAASRAAPSAPLSPPAPGAPSATGTVIYNSLPIPQPPNVPSLGFEATSTSEFGDHISFAGTARKATKVTVLMSAWEVHSNFPGVGDSDGWMHPITLKLYAVNNAGPTPAPGTLIASVTQSFKVPWRPVADPTCSGGTAWRSDSDGLCYNGYAFNIVFDLTSLNLTLPNEIIYGIAYNTADYGAAPILAPGPYNSLNVGLTTVGPSVGTDVNLDDVVWNTSHAPFYTDGGAGGVGIFRQDTNWTGYVPSARFEVAPNVVVVGPGAMNGWLFYNDTTDTIDNSLGTFVAGPGTPINGKGSAQITISPNPSIERTNLATYQFAGTKLNAITTMMFEIYNPSGKDVTTGFLNFNVDWDGSDTWQRRLVFSTFPVVQDTWRNIDALGSSMWHLSGGNWPAGLGGEPGSVDKPWSTIAAYNPGIARIRQTDAHLGLRVGSGSATDNYTENFSSFTFGTNAGTTVFDFEPAAELRFTPATSLVPVGAQVPINIDIATAGLPIQNLAGYQFDVNYNKTVLNGFYKGLYVNSFFDAASNAFRAYEVPSYDDATGVGKYGVTKTAPTPGAPVTTYTGYGTLASVSFTATAPGVSVLTFSNVIFSDAAPMGLPVYSTTATVTVYGYATVNGTVKLQGRATPITAGPITLVDTSGTFATVNTTYNATTGAFSVVVPALAAGTTYTLTADHDLYLASRKLQTVTPGNTYAQPTTVLKGGDANNDERVALGDLTCIGSTFGTAVPTCTGGSSDINADGIVNIFDLVITGGNYGLPGPNPGDSGPVPW